MVFNKIIKLRINKYKKKKKIQNINLENNANYQLIELIKNQIILYRNHIKFFKENLMLPKKQL